MKQSRTLLLYVLTALLSVLSLQSAEAQQRQDALYIFRNDGQFNAFFYGDIERIEYSRVDTFGIKRHDYVVQEIYALDSVYRIPLSAIDSVSFVTPENKIRNDVVMPDPSIADYIVASDSVSWIRLAANTPKEMIPKEGEKIFIKEFSKYIPDGFVGLVTSVTSGPGGHTVVTDELALTDVFDRLVAKTAAFAYEEGEENARRYGFFDGTDLDYTSEEPIELPTIAGSIPFTGSRALGSAGPVEFSGDVTGALNYSIKRKLEIRAFLYIDAATLSFKYDQRVRSDNDIDLGASLSGTFTANVDFPMKGVAKKLSDFFKAKVSAGVFVGAQFTGITFNYTRKFKTQLHTQIVADEKDLPSLPGGVPVPFYSYHYDVERDTTEWSSSIYDKFSFSAGAYAEVSLGVCYPFKKWDTPVDENQLAVKMKLRAELGGKLDVGIPKLNLPLVMTSEPLPQLSLYRLLNTQTDISLMGYGKLSLQGELGKWKGSFDPEIDVLKTGHLGMVPNITGINVSQDKEMPIRPYRLLMAAPLEGGRQLILAKEIGFAIYDKNGTFYTDSLCDAAFARGGCTDDKWVKDGLYRAVFTNIDPGKDGPVTYTAYPMVKYDGWKLLVDQKKSFTLEAARFDIEQRELNIVQEEDYSNTDLHMEVIPNMKNVDIKSEAKWISEPFFQEQENDLWISWQELPEDVKWRRGVIRLEGLSSKNGDVLVEDSIVVTQAPPYIELSTDSLIFDIKGGTQSLSIVSTNLENLRVVPVANDYFIKSCKLDGDIITVTLDKSDTDERKSFVRVWGDGPSGRTYDNFGFWIKQCEDNTIPKVDPEKLAFEAKGGNGTVKFHKGKYLYSDVYVSDEGQSWAHASMADNGVVTVTVDPNENNQDRECYVVCYAYDKPNPTDDDLVKVYVLVQQEALNRGEEITEYIISDVYAEIKWNTLYTWWPFKSVDEGYVKKTENSTYTMTPDNTGLTGHWDYFRNEGCYSKIFAAPNNGWNVDTFWKVKKTSPRGQSISFTMPDGAESDCIKNFTYDYTIGTSDAKTHWRVAELKFDSETVYDTSDSEYSSCVMRKYYATRSTGMDITEFENWDTLDQLTLEYGGRQNYSVLAPDPNDYIVIWVAIWKK
jgi:hypothetical protein